MVKLRFEANRPGQPKIDYAGFLKAAGILTKKYAQQAVTVLKVYPPERPGQVYRRTFMLRNSWSTIGPQMIRGGVETYFVNVAFESRPQGRYYPPYVINNKRNLQAAIHRGRWHDLVYDSDIMDQRKFGQDCQELFDKFMIQGRGTVSAV